LNFVHLEGFCLPPAEALISGCYVIGYDGRAAAEFMNEPYAQVIAYGDFQNFILKTEQAAELFENNPRAFLEITKKGSEEIRMRYTREKEKEGLLKAFDKLLSQV
jgi:glycosyltransferase involved in cell wall biosynthesis